MSEAAVSTIVLSIKMPTIVLWKRLRPKYLTGFASISWPDTGHTCGIELFCAIMFFNISVISYNRLSYFRQCELYLLLLSRAFDLIFFDETVSLLEHSLGLVKLLLHHFRLKVHQVLVLVLLALSRCLQGRPRIFHAHWVALRVPTRSVLDHRQTLYLACFVIFLIRWLNFSLSWGSLCFVGGVLLILIRLGYGGRESVLRLATFMRLEVNGAEREALILDISDGVYYAAEFLL